MFDYSGIINYLSLLLMFVMGILVVINDRKSKNNWIYFLFTLSIIGWIVSLYFGWEYANYAKWGAVLSWMRFAYGFSVLGMSFMTLFLYSFPRPTFDLPKIVKIIFLGSIPFLFLISSFTPAINESLIIEDGVYVWDAYGSLYFLYLIDIIFNLIASTYLAISKLKKLQGIEKEKMTIVSYGYLTFVTVAVLTNVILPLFDIMLIKEYSQLLILFFIIPTFYSIHKYRFFNFPNTFLNLIRKIILTSIFLITIFLLFNFLTTFLPKISIHLAGLLSSFIGLTILGIAEKLMPELITESFREFKNAITEFKGKINYCDTYLKFQEIAESTFILNLNFTNAKIYVIRKTKAKLDHIPVYTKNKFTELLKCSKCIEGDLLVKDEINFKKMIDDTDKKILSSALAKLEADLCLPLFSENNLIGFFALKKKEDGGPYSREEIEEILTIKKYLEICLMNILLKMNLQEENNLMKAIINERTKELRKKIEVIKELVRQQSDFMAVTAHELRTPLSIAMFQVEDILESDKKSPQACVNLKHVSNALDNLKGLTQKLFEVQQYDLIKIKLKKEKVNMNQFIKSLYANFIPIMKKKRMKFSLENKLPGKTHCNFDKPLIHQVLHNLLSNAYKFTDKGGNIALTIEKNKKHILIKVIDNGNGVPNTYKKKIFEKFRTTKSGAGIGLGLYICKKIIELHKGKIWVEDSPEKGATFCLDLSCQ